MENIVVVYAHYCSSLLLFYTMLTRLSAARALPRKFAIGFDSPIALKLSQNFALFSSDSHDDFAPKRKAVVENEDEAISMIKSHVTENKVMLYMKGSPSTPMCGFSARVVHVLKNEGVDFASVNVLDYPAIREGVKKYSSWPTIPQLYINGEFIGGCDIVTSMHESGELSSLLKEIEVTGSNE
jgi:monothiol glutaredoxin